MSEPELESSDRSVSVVMPVGRVDADLGTQLDALAGQSYPDSWELVISLNTDSAAQRRALEAELAQRPDLEATIAEA